MFLNPLADHNVGAGDDSINIIINQTCRICLKSHMEVGLFGMNVESKILMKEMFNIQVSKNCFCFC